MHVHECTQILYLTLPPPPSLFRLLFSQTEEQKQCALKSVNNDETRAVTRRKNIRSAISYSLTHMFTDLPLTCSRQTPYCSLLLRPPYVIKIGLTSLR